jgi:hypothetical protein
MKLSDHVIAINNAFEALIASMEDLEHEPQLNRSNSGKRVCRDLSRNRTPDIVPRFPITYEPLVYHTSLYNKEKLLQIAAFEATYQDAQTPISPDMVPLIIDTGASITVTPYKTDFVSTIRPVQAVEIKGIAAGLQVKGFGDVSYSFYNDDRELQTMVLRNYLYVPQCTARLLCPRQIGIETGNPMDGFNSISDKSILTVQGKTTTMHYDRVSQLPILYTGSGMTTFHRFCAHQTFVKPVFSPDNKAFLYQNLTPKQQRKMHLHERCAHVHWGQLNAWIRAGLLPCSPSLASEPDPVCAACQFGKAHKRSHKVDTGHFAKCHSAPGDGVSSDGMEAGCPGRPMTTSGLPTQRRYKYVSFWVDHYSQFVYITMHETKKAEELLRSKLEFEEFASKFGVNIKNIRADNGVYTAKVIQDSCAKKQQQLTFCAVGAHWQNGIADRFIGSIVQRARTLLLHAMAKWPSVVTEEMWPFALRHMVCFHNATVRRDKNESPYQLFTGQEAPWLLKDFRVFGCPVYVLHKRLQDGDNFSKWKARSWQGLYVGPSTCHASNIPLIYNPATTHVSPQFHVVYDEGFTSVTPIANMTNNLLLEKLYNKAFWTYNPTMNDQSDDYHFTSFWDPSLLPPTSNDKGNQRSVFKATRQQSPIACSFPDASPTNASHLTCLTPAVSTAAGDDHTLEQTITVLHGAVSVPEGVSPSNLSNTRAVSVPEGVSPSSLSNTGAVSVPEGVPQSSIQQAVSASYSTQTSAVSAKQNDKARSQYAIYQGSTEFSAYKQQHGINGNIYVAKSATINENEAPSVTSDINLEAQTIYPHVFSTFMDLPVLYTETSIQAFLATNNKDDTLTQSQMLRLWILQTL